MVRYFCSILRGPVTHCRYCSFFTARRCMPICATVRLAYCYRVAVTQMTSCQLLPARPTSWRRQAMTVKLSSGTWFLVTTAATFVLRSHLSLTKVQVGQNADTSTLYNLFVFSNTFICLDESPGGSERVFMSWLVVSRF